MKRHGKRPIQARRVASEDAPEFSTGHLIDLAGLLVVTLAIGLASLVHAL